VLTSCNLLSEQPVLRLEALDRALSLPDRLVDDVDAWTVAVSLDFHFLFVSLCRLSDPNRSTFLLKFTSDMKCDLLFMSDPKCELLVKLGISQTSLFPIVFRAILSRPSEIWYPWSAGRFLRNLVGTSLAQDWLYSFVALCNMY